LEGYAVVTASDGEEGMRLAFDARPDLIVLDIMMPCWTGLDILEELRKRGRRVPVLILSARDRTRHKVEGLRLGADDYMTKPFDLPELLARIEVMLRRQRSEAEASSAMSCGNLALDRKARTVRAGGRRVELSAREFDLLWLLAASPGRVFTREEILQSLWGWDYEGTARTVDNFVSSLRKKLRTARPGSPCIRTVPRIGYKFAEE
jgi:DNA-binding response OmpR family regulator